MPKIVIVAHNIRSLYNVGSIFRNSDCFGIAELALSGYTGFPPEKQISKTALGAENTVVWKKYSTLSKALADIKKRYPKIKVVALENNVNGRKVKNIRTYIVKNDIALVLGEEVKGLNKRYYKYIDEFVEIPMTGSKESLNVAVASGVAMYALTVKSFPHET